jgi:peptide chain release factor 1
MGVALTNPEIIGDNKKFGQLSKEYRSLEKIVQAYGDYKKLLDDVDFYKEALNGDDEELRELAKEELPQLGRKRNAWKAASARC